MAKRIDIRHIRKLSSEEIQSMSKDEVIKYLDIANVYGEKFRKQALKQMQEHPEIPKPQIFRDFHGRREVENWETYEFVTDKSEKISTLKRRLNSVVGFLNAKTLNYEQWEDQMKNFSERIIRKSSPRTARGTFAKKLSADTYNRFWKVYNKVLEIYNPKDIGYKYNPEEKREFTPTSFVMEELTKHPKMDDNTLAILIAEELENKVNEILSDKRKEDELQERTMTKKFKLGRRGFDI